MSDLYRLVRDFREARGPSRNRAFEQQSQPLARRAFRIHQRLCGLEQEVRAGAHVETERCGDEGYVIRVVHPEVRARREAYLTAEEYTLLCVDPVLATLLQPVDSDDSDEIGRSS